MKKINLVIPEKNLLDLVDVIESSEFESQSNTITSDGKTWITYSKQNGKTMDIVYLSDEKELFMHTTFDLDEQSNKDRLDLMLNSYKEYHTAYESNLNSSTNLIYAGIGMVLGGIALRHPAGVVGGGGFGYVVGRIMSKSKNDTLTKDLMEKSQSREFSLGIQAYEKINGDKK